MIATCASCGADFEAKRGTAKFCSGRCRKRAADARGRATVVPIDRSGGSQERQELQPSAISAALLAQYGEASLATPVGQIAIKLASDVDAMTPGTPGYASTVAQLRSVIDDLNAVAAPAKANPLVLLRERHASSRLSG